MQQEFRPAGSSYIDTPKHVRHHPDLRLIWDSAQISSGGLAWAQTLPEIEATAWIIVCHACDFALASLMSLQRLLSLGFKYAASSHSREWKQFSLSNHFTLHSAQPAFMLLCYTWTTVKDRLWKAGTLDREYWNQTLQICTTSSIPRGKVLCCYTPTSKSLLVPFKFNILFLHFTPLKRHNSHLCLKSIWIKKQKKNLS